MSGILHSVFCSCFANPTIVHDNEEEVVNNTWTHVPTIPSKKSVDISRHPAATSQQQQGEAKNAPNQENMDGGNIQPFSNDVDQTNNVFPVPWKIIRGYYLDLLSIPEVKSIVRKPVQVDQSEIHTYSRDNLNKGDKVWGGEDFIPFGFLEDKEGDPEGFPFPLPWEAKPKHVSYTQTTTGPSWDQVINQSSYYLKQ